MKPISLFGDNLAGLWIARTKTNSTRTKHYNLKLHYIYELINDGTISTKHIDGTDNFADFLTKIQEVNLYLKQRNFFVTVSIEDLLLFTAPQNDKSDLTRHK